MKCDVAFVVLVLSVGFGAGLPQWYQQQRNDFLKIEASQRLGADLMLSAKEKQVDAIFLAEKRKVFESTRLNSTVFPPAVSFFQSKSVIENSHLYTMLRVMPKGGALHTHDSSITSLKWLVEDVTYRPNCYICFPDDGGIRFNFSAKAPANKDCVWKTVSSVRNSYRDPHVFDKQLMLNISIVADRPYPDVNSVWSKFSKYFEAVNGLLSYAPVFRDYFRQALLEFWQDVVQYIEIRALLPETYELDGTVHDAEWALNMYRDEVREFQKVHPDFIGVKIIQSGIRFFSKGKIINNIKQAMHFYQKYPDIFKGYDLVGQEGPSHTLLFYLNDLLYPATQDPPVNLPYFFHAGETDWQGTGVDENLIDALLLNTTRIGHGYAIHKHPEVMRLIKQRGTTVEVNPISNQVLGLVGDLRNHAANDLIAQNFSIVISSDDPAVWMAHPLTHDYYMAFMGMTGETTGLSFLKQIAINSLKCSTLNGAEQDNAFKLWQKNWDKFLDIILAFDRDFLQQSSFG